MKLNATIKAILLLGVCLFYATDSCLGQQWTGSSDLTGLLHRSGDIRANGLFLGKYGSAFLGSTDPFAIYSPETSGTQDLLFFGNGSVATLNLRLHDGSLKIGPSTTPNAMIDNNGKASLADLEVGFASPAGLEGAASYGGVHLRQAGGNDRFVGITSSATSSGTQGGC
jgi:hypothetical protein